MAKTTSVRRYKRMSGRWREIEGALVYVIIGVYAGVVDSTYVTQSKKKADEVYAEYQGRYDGDEDDVHYLIERIK